MQLKFLAFALLFSNTCSAVARDSKDIEKSISDITALLASLTLAIKEIQRAAQWNENPHRAGLNLEAQSKSVYDKLHADAMSIKPRDSSDQISETDAITKVWGKVQSVYSAADASTQAFLDAKCAITWAGGQQLTRGYLEHIFEATKQWDQAVNDRLPFGARQIGQVYISFTHSKLQGAITTFGSTYKC